MSALLCKVTFRWPRAAQPLLRDLDLVLEPGWTALLGANGTGKTTILRLLTGELAPDRGRVRVDGDVHLCRQEAHLPSEDVVAFAARPDGQARRWRGRLGLDVDDLERWSALSPGERKRWQIGAALAREPAVLLLDEPTNHLDARGRDQLVRALSTYRGVGLVVSHDRAFLDALATSTVWLRDGEARTIPLPPGPSMHLLDTEAASQLATLEQVQAAQRAVKTRLDHARREQAAAEASRSSARRMKGRKDHDARSIGAKVRAEVGATRRAQASGKLRARLDVLADHAGAMARPSNLGGEVSFPHTPSPRGRLLEHPFGDVRTPDGVLLRDVDLALERGRHVHLSGSNGAGKTTLIRSLLASHTLPEDRVVHLPQELANADVRGLLHRLAALPRATRGQVMTALAALGADPSAVAATDHPSPGMARKLAIALALGTDAWALVLDEPTNHLDLPGVLRLQAALATFPGALLLVTHDEALAAACCDLRWRISDGRVVAESLAPTPETASGGYRWTQ